MKAKINLTGQASEDVYQESINTPTEGDLAQGRGALMESKNLGEGPGESENPGEGMEDDTSAPF